MKRIFSPEHRLALSEAAKRRAAVLPAPPGFTFKGRKHNDAFKEVIAESNRRRAKAAGERAEEECPVCNGTGERGSDRKACGDCGGGGVKKVAVDPK